jgi:small subunit ribosomal protein S16
MSVVIRMQRAGGRNYPFFRVVVADSRRARDGRFLEKVGYYNPLAKPFQVELDRERLRYWVERGARPSEAVAALMRKASVPTAPERPPVAEVPRPPAPEAPPRPPAPEAPRAETPPAAETP